MLKTLLKKTIITLRRDGLNRTMSKSKNRIKSIYKIIKLRKKLTNNDWRLLKNKYEGKRVFLIGNGPSLNKTQLYLLKDEFTLCFNRFFIIDERINWKPSFYSTTDNVVLSDIIDEVKEFIPKTIYSFFPDIHFRGENFHEKIGDFKNLFWLNQLHSEGFSKNLPKVYPGGSVIYEGIQILNYLGFKEIYLVGVDLSYKVHKTVKYLNENSLDIESQEDDDPNHFDPRYFGKNRKYHQPEEFVIKNIFRNLKYISDIASEIKVNIINAGIDSKLEYFPKEELNNILNLTSIQIDKLFNEVLSKNSSYQNVKHFKSENLILNDIQDIDCRKDSDFYTSLENAIKLMNKVIFTHIPLGPHNDLYYFIKREHVEN